MTTTSPTLPPDLARVQRLLDDFSAVAATENAPILQALARVADAGGPLSMADVYDDLLEGRESRTDGPWRWLLDAAHSAMSQGAPELAAAIGQFVEFTHAGGMLSWTALLDLAEMRLWPMSPRMLAPFTNVTLRALSAVPPTWRRVDGSGDSVDAKGLGLMWSLSAEEIEGLDPDVVAIAQGIRHQKGISAAQLPDAAPTLTRAVRKNARLRAALEETERASGFAGSREYALGMDLAARRAFREAMPHFEAAAAAGHVEAAVQGGHAADEVGDGQSAFRLFALAGSRGSGEGALQLGIRLVEQGRLQEARQWYEFAVSRGAHRACLGLGVMAREQGDWAGGRRWWSKAPKRTSGSAWWTSPECSRRTLKAWPSRKSLPSCARAARGARAQVSSATRTVHSSRACSR